MLLCVVRIFMNQTLCDQCYLNVELLVGCNDYRILNETQRNGINSRHLQGVLGGVMHNESGDCWDCHQPAAAASQWHGDDCYRFLPPAGTRIAEEAPGDAYCGTDASGWMQGSHPTSLGATVTRTVCFQSDSNTCHWSSEIKVRNCGQFFFIPFGCYTSLCYCFEIAKCQICVQLNKQTNKPHLGPVQQLHNSYHNVS